MELTLLRLGKEAIYTESPENFSDMLLVGGHVCRVDEDVIQVCILLHKHLKYL